MNDPFTDVVWYDALDLGLRGIGWRDAARQNPYDRLPSSLEALLSPELWRLSTHSAGLYVDFRSSARDIYVRWQLLERHRESSYMADCGASGIDGYGRDSSGKWRWVGAQGASGDTDNRGQLNFAPLDGVERMYRVYLPLMCRVQALHIGAREGLSPVPVDSSAPIVYYGTSIVHGVGVSRAGMPHAAQIARSLDRELLNLGFSGRAWCEAAIAEALGRQEASCYLIDVLPNNSPEQLAERLPVFLRILRKAQRGKPILLLGDRVYGDAAFVPQRAEQFRAKNRVLDQLVRALEDEGSGGLHVVLHPHWYGADSEGSSDASHPNDLGAWCMAQSLEPLLRQLLAGPEA